MITRLRNIWAESGFTGMLKRLQKRCEREWAAWASDCILRCTGSYYKGRISGDLQPSLAAQHFNNNLLTTLPQPVLQHYFKHQFDLLGSGWVRVYYGMSCCGLHGIRFEAREAIETDAKGIWLKPRINRSNLRMAQQIWQYVSADYHAIDWQLDFKSGFRWSEKQCSKKIKFGLQLGVDIKVPWELARMQHLPQMALAALNATELERKKISLEYQNQVLDFMATNPPGFGVNWVCSMDIAIRIANWIIARDLLRLAGLHFPDYFDTFLLRSIKEHGEYILANLEWSASRANHYLANIAGLAFVASSLPANATSDAWLAFVIEELIQEVSWQFHPEGSNFEGSTAYHRLSTEMVYYATARIIGLPDARLVGIQCANKYLVKTGKNKPDLQRSPLSLYSLAGMNHQSFFPLHYFCCMQNMLHFISDITKPDACIPQIGDSDSGRFCKMAPLYIEMPVFEAKNTYSNLEAWHELPADDIYFQENHLDSRHLLAAGEGLFGTNDVSENYLVNHHPDSAVLRAMSRGLLLPLKASVQDSFLTERLQDNAIFKEALTDLERLRPEQVRRFEFSSTSNLRDGLKTFAWPDFGVYILKSPQLYLLVRCWAAGVPKHSAHRHFDQLSLELSIDGCDVISDPGAYLYTPMPELRNFYRSHSAHFSPMEGVDLACQNVFSSLIPEAATIRYFSLEGFVAEIEQASSTHQLIISLGNQSVVIYHASSLWQTESLLQKGKAQYSPGYGIRQK